MSSYYEKILATGEVKCIDEEVPFEIPVSWSWARLTHVTYLIEDCPHSTAKDEGKGYPLVRTPNIGFGFLQLMVYIGFLKKFIISGMLELCLKG